MAREDAKTGKTTAKRTTPDAKRKAAAKPAEKTTRKVAEKTTARKTTTRRVRGHDLEQEMTVDNLLAQARVLEAERLARAAAEQGKPRALRDPLAVRPANPVKWGYPWNLDKALPADERAELVAFFSKFTQLQDSRGGFYVAGPATDPETRRATWDAGGIVVELEQLRAQMPPDELGARRERLAQVLTRKTGEAWAEMNMLLTTWDEATLPLALADVERVIADWPDELRIPFEPWKTRPELHALARTHAGPIDGSDLPGHVTVVRTQDIAAVEAHQATLSRITMLELSGHPGLPSRVAACTELVGLERLVLHQPTYSSGTAPSQLPLLLAAPHLQNLKSLSLYGYTLSDADLAALAACDQPLVDLKIEYASMKPKAAAALAKLAARKQLRSLQLKYNDLGPQGARTLFTNPDDWRHLRVLDLSANEIGDRGVEAIAAAGLVELRWLNLSSNAQKNALTAASATALASSSALARLETINLFGHPIGGEGVVALLHAPALRSLRGLNAGFPSASLADIVAHLGTDKPTGVTELNLTNLQTSKKKPPLDLSAATFLRDVRMLNIESIDGAEYKAVLDCPHLESLEILAFGGCYSNDSKAFEALVTCEPPPRLRYLDIAGWKLTPEQARRLVDSKLGRQLWGVDLMSTYTTPEVWHVVYQGGLPLASHAVFDSDAPSEHVTTTVFYDEI